VLVDPGDPSGQALDRAKGLVASRGGAIEAVALTHVDPDHAAGAEAIADALGIPVFVGPGGGKQLPYAVRELADLEMLAAGDVRLVAVHSPGPRPDHVAFIVGAGGSVISGDLDGVRGARSIPGPVDPDALAASRERLLRLAPRAGWLAGHPAAPGVV
jgi:glyoxylase-like metal-dependent hydrolase (beta-lactamase superfamily II)